MIFLAFAFDIKEMHTLFMKFYRDFDKDENMTFDKEELIQCFEVFARPDLLGVDNMKIVLNNIESIMNLLGGLILSIFKEG